MVDSTLAFDILARDRGASSVFEKVARSADKTSASLTKTGKVSDSVAKASANLTKAHDSESNALDKVQVAEARLAEIRNKGNSKSSQILAAEKSLAKARREAAAAGNVAQKASRELGEALDNEGKKAGKSLGSSLKKWFTGDGKGLFKQIGEDGGTVFGSGLLGALKTPILGPAIIGIVGGVVATVMPAIGAIAGTALITGFGAGLAGLGVVFAAKSDVVKQKWKTTLDGMGKDMSLLSQPFEATLSNIAGYAQRTFDNFKPTLAKAFTNLAEPIDRFANDSLRALDKFKPAIDPIVTATGRVLTALGGALPGAVQNMADGFAKLARSVADNPTALADTVTGLGNVVRMITDGITSLNDLNGKFETLTGGTSAVDVVMGILAGTVGTLFGTFSLLNKALDALGLKTKDYKAAVDITGKSQELWTQGLDATQLAALGVSSTAATTAGHVQTLAEKTAAAKQAAADYTTKLNDWLTAMFKVQGLAITLAGAQISLKDAIAQASAAVKENGHATDINTEKGRANKTALINVAKAANDQTEAMNRSKVGIAKSAQAAESSRASFIKLAEKMGYSAGEARKMARDMIAIPNVTREAKLQANKKDLETKLSQAKTALADKSLTATKRAKLEAQIETLKSQIRAAQGAIDSLHGKTVKVTVNTYKNMIETTTHNDIGVRLPGRASGGPVKKGQPYKVGEEGEEVFWPDQNGTIIPHGKTARGTALVASAGEQFLGTVRLELTLDGKVIQQKLLKLKRTNGVELGLA